MKINHKSKNVKDKLLGPLINLATVRELSVNISLIQWKMSGSRLDSKFLPK